MLVVIGAIVGVATAAIALFVDWLPESASVQRDRIDFVFWLATAICVAIFAIVAAVIIYAVWKFRAQPDDDTDGPPVHGNTGLEIAWTAIPALLVIVIGVASSVVLIRNEKTGSNPLRIDVTAQQFAWSFKYPNGVTAGMLRLPVDRTVVLSLQSRDVIHSFWVPEFGQKQDAVPGITTRLVITPDKIGSYPVICTELCGLGHSIMRTQAVVMPQNEYAAWAQQQGQATSGGTPAEAGKAVFENEGCGSCHTFKPAGSSGKVGPDLDGLAAAAQKAGKPLEDFVRESIVDPSAYVAPGYPDNIMPKTFGELPKTQLDALVQYLTQSTGGTTQ
jgi:cytochrome c oxidase subunit II